MNKQSQFFYKIKLGLVFKYSESTFLETDFPKVNGSVGTEPFIASSNTVADTIVFIGTPSLL